jgi:hypothetical protein
MPKIRAKKIEVVGFAPEKGKSLKDQICDAPKSKVSLLLEAGKSFALASDKTRRQWDRLAQRRLAA